jgi:hypothetical protein
MYKGAGVVDPARAGALVIATREKKVKVKL